MTWIVALFPIVIFVIIVFLIRIPVALFAVLSFPVLVCQTELTCGCISFLASIGASIGQVRFFKPYSNLINRSRFGV